MMKKNCTEYENRLDDLMSLHNSFRNDKDSINYEDISLMACLLCRNSSADALKNFVKLFLELTTEEPLNPLYWFALARIYQMALVYNKAEEAYNLATTLDPGNIVYLEYYARFYLKREMVEQALTYFNRSVDCGSENNDRYSFECGKAFFRRGEIEKAKICLEQCKNFMEEEYFVLLSKCYHMLCDYPKSIECSKNGLNLHSNPEFINLIADSFFEMGEYIRALEQYELLIEETNAEGEYIGNIGACKSNLGYYDDAISCFNKALECNPQNTIALKNKAKTLLKLDNNNLTSALEIYHRVIEITPNDTSAIYSLADLFFSSGQYREAIKYYTEIIRRDNKRTDILRLISLSHSLLQEYDKAVQYTLLAIGNSTATYLDYARLGRCYAGSDQLELAIQNYKKALDLEPYDPTILAALASTFRMRKQYDNAASYYRQAVEIAVDDYVLWYYYGALLLEMGRSLDAVRAFTKHYELKQDDASANHLGWAYYTNGEYESAIKYFNKAIKDKPNEQVYKINLFLAYDRLGQYDKLLSYMKEKKDDLFSDTISLLILAQLHIRFGDSTSAITIIDELLRDDDVYLMRSLITCLKGTAYYCSTMSDRLDKAITEFKSIDSTSFDAIFTKAQVNVSLGQCFLEKGEYQNAIAALELAVKGLGENDAVAWDYLGFAYLRNNNIDKALKCFERVMSCENAFACTFTYYLFEKIVGLSKKEKKYIVKKFYSILDQVYILKRILRYDITKRSVYHYTSQETLASLIKDGARIRMSNSAYMNDPEEGVALQRLMKKGHTAIANDKTELIPHSDTFLVSFSEEKDILSMWVQYAQNATGCSIGLGDDFFDTDDNNLQFVFTKIIADYKERNPQEECRPEPIREMQNISRQLKAEINSISEANFSDDVAILTKNTIDIFSNHDVWQNQYISQYMSFMYNVFNGNIVKLPTEKYCLYKVCYVNNSNIIINFEPSKAEQIMSCISAIDDKIVELETATLSTRGSSIAYLVTNECLNQIRYLFKSSDYRHEKEVRLVIFEPLASRAVKVVDRDKQLPKLYLEVDKPLHFRELVLGSKVERPDGLVPALVKSGIVDEDKIRRSKIKYR